MKILYFYKKVSGSGYSVYARTLCIIMTRCSQNLKMKTNKDFDTVIMMRDIREKIHAEYERILS